MLTISDILIRLGLAVLTGFVVGLERERHHRPAGIKTHILVCMGATIVSLIQIEMLHDIVKQVTGNPDLANVLKSDYGRLGAQVISGIGFLGAGTIMRTRGSIRGLTTAATLWLVACVGLGIGMGYYKISVISIALVMAVMLGSRFFQTRSQQKRGMKIIEFQFINKKESVEMINDYLSTKSVSVKTIEFLEDQDETSYHDKPIIHCNYTITTPQGVDVAKLISDLSIENNIIQVREGLE